jgi:DNA-binding NtrC family response regulator
MLDSDPRSSSGGSFSPPEFGERRVDGARRSVSKEDRWVIVVVDDDRGARDALVALFENRYRVIACVGAVSGVAAVNDETGTVILGLGMRGRDGVWACSEMRKRVPGLPVIFSSGYQSSRDPCALLHEHRPFDHGVRSGGIEWLVEAVDVALRLQRMQATSKNLLRKLRAERTGGG